MANGCGVRANGDRASNRRLVPRLLATWKGGDRDGFTYPRAGDVNGTLAGRQFQSVLNWPMVTMRLAAGSFLSAGQATGGLR
jgi:hypothetical protein